MPLRPILHAIASNVCTQGTGCNTSKMICILHAIASTSLDPAPPTRATQGEDTFLLLLLVDRGAPVPPFVVDLILPTRFYNARSDSA